LELIRIWKFKW